MVEPQFDKKIPVKGYAFYQPELKTDRLAKKFYKPVKC